MEVDMYTDVYSVFLGASAIIGAFNFIYKKNFFQPTVGIILLIAGAGIIIISSPDYKKLSVYKKFEKEVKLEQKQGHIEFKGNIAFDKNSNIVSVDLIPGTTVPVKK